MKRVLWLAISMTLALGGCSGHRSAQPEAGVGSDVNWPAVGGGTDETSYSRLANIDTGNVKNLGLAWSMDLPGEVTLEATPLAVDGVLFFTGSCARAYAAVASTGKLLC